MVNGAELNHGSGFGCTAAVFKVEQAVEETSAQHKAGKNHLIVGAKWNLSVIGLVIVSD